jgi:tRNA dimethylallyltransferase
MPLVSKPRIIVVCGPTAAGKTRTAVQLAQRFDGEIVNADSMQVYRYMDIGTAKPTAEERALARHHLVDLVDPDAPFDAACFARLGREAIMDIAARSRVPIVAGGTGLYLKALLYGLAREAHSDPALRRRLMDEVATEGSDALHRRLAAVDPATASRVHPNDAVRIVRALEVHGLSGRPLSEHHRRHAFGDAPYASFKVGLVVDRETLYTRIEERVEAMLAEGLEAEVRGLLARGYGPDLKSMQALGYRHMCAYLGGEVGLDEAVAALKRDTRRFAKRQFTWFRADPEIHWTAPENLDPMLPQIEAFLEGDAV